MSAQVHCSNRWLFSPWFPWVREAQRVAMLAYLGPMAVADSYRSGGSTSPRVRVWIAQGFARDHLGLDLDHNDDHPQHRRAPDPDGERG